MLRLQEITINECIYAQPNLHEKVVKEIIAKAGQINVKVSDHSLLSNLQRRIKQQEGVRLSRSMSIFTSLYILLEH